MENLHRDAEIIEINVIHIGKGNNMIRTRRKDKKVEIPSKLGGHMPNPPESCTAPKFVSDKNGCRYVDNVFCIDCKDKEICRRRKEFIQEWKTYRELIEQE
jgi:hypothetical protein